jgi:hypothetical protein
VEVLSGIGSRHIPKRDVILTNLPLRVELDDDGSVAQAGMLCD